MSKIAYNWQTTEPPRPSVYLTRRGESKYLTARYWDGDRWWEIGYGRRGGQPFVWPKNSYLPRTEVARLCANSMVLRAIHKGAELIQWGDPHRVFDDTEVLKYLIQAGELRSDWREFYQHKIRVFVAGGGKL